MTPERFNELKTRCECFKFDYETDWQIALSECLVEITRLQSLLSSPPPADERVKALEFALFHLRHDIQAIYVEDEDTECRNDEDCDHCVILQDIHDADKALGRSGASKTANSLCDTHLIPETDCPACNPLTPSATEKGREL